MESDNKIPRFALKLLRWFCPQHLLEEIEGDLTQKFEEDVTKHGMSKARRRLNWNVLRYFRPGIIFRHEATPQAGPGPLMFNFIRITLRGMARNKTFSLINVAGLAVGLTAFVMIVQYASFEMSFDRHHKNSDELYRIGYRIRENGEIKSTSAKNLIGIRPLLTENFPEVESHTGFWQIPANSDFVFRYEDRVYMEPGEYIFADSNFLRVFPDLLIKGDADHVLDDPHNLIISEKLAHKIFGDKDPIGLPIEDIVDPGDDGTAMVIAGVMKDFPENSHFHADFLSQMGHSWDTASYYWDTPSFYTYARLAAGTDPLKFEQRLNSLLSEKATDNPSIKGSETFLQPVSSIHLGDELGDEYESNGNRALVYLLLVVGIFILAIAWINYINLETAQFLSKTREIGIRRIIGSTRWHIALQFFVRYACLMFFAGVLCLGALYFLLPVFSNLMRVPLQSIHWNSPEVLWGGLSVLLVGSLLAGLYPAVYFTRFNPSASIGGQPITGGKNNFRTSLVTFQFTVSIVLIALVIVINQQLDFMRVSNKRIDVDQVITIKNAFAYANGEFDVKRKEFIGLENKLMQSAPVNRVCSSSAIPGTEIGFTLINEIKRSSADPYNSTRFKLLFIDYNFIPLYDLRLKAGRNYREGDAPENAGVIILNEKAIHELGFKSPEDALGKTVHFPLWPWMKPDSEIIGVVEDYHHEAIKRPVMPMIFFLNRGSFQQVYYSVRINAGSKPSEALTSIETAWHDIFPERPFEYFFLDDYYDQQFKSELQFGSVFGLFAVVAVALCCLGILGMTLFEANARLREISIRKVLGATVVSLLGLLSREQVKVIGVATVLAAPLIYWVAIRWLSNYPSRINITPLIFIVPLATVVALVAVTASFQMSKAANTNPVDHLKRE